MTKLEATIKQFENALTREEVAEKIYAQLPKTLKYFEDLLVNLKLNAQ